MPNSKRRPRASGRRGGSRSRGSCSRRFCRPLLTGFALAFARAVGEYGSVIFIAGNIPMVSEITPLIIITKLEQFDYRGATAVASVMLVISFVLLLVVNGLQAWIARRERGGRSDGRRSSNIRYPPARRRQVRSQSGDARFTVGSRSWSSVSGLTYFAVFLLLPLIAVFVEAFRKGVDAYFAALIEPDALSAIRLTLLAAAIAVPLNLLFGLAAAWAVAKFQFPGKNLLITLIDLPFSVSPVVAGLDLRSGVRVAGLVRPLARRDHDIKIIFAVPAIVLATIFVTFPFIARELIPLMQAQGRDEEEAAISLGASGLQTFWRVTIPNVKWALLYGVILCNARAMGEFGAVSVVSGHIRGETNTMPLHVEILYNEYQFAAAFAVASLLALLALVTLALKTYVEWRAHRPIAEEQSA